MLSEVGIQGGAKSVKSETADRTQSFLTGDQNL